MYERKTPKIDDLEYSFYSTLNDLVRRVGLLNLRFVIDGLEIFCSLIESGIGGGMR